MSPSSHWYVASVDFNFWPYSTIIHKINMFNLNLFPNPPFIDNLSIYYQNWMDEANGCNLRAAGFGFDGINYRLKLYSFDCINMQIFNGGYIGPKKPFIAVRWVSDSVFVSFWDSPFSESVIRFNQGPSFVQGPSVAHNAYI